MLASSPKKWRRAAARQQRCLYFVSYCPTDIWSSSRASIRSENYQEGWVRFEKNALYGGKGSAEQVRHHWSTVVDRCGGAIERAGESQPVYHGRHFSRVRGSGLPWWTSPALSTTVGKTRLNGKPRTVARPLSTVVDMCSDRLKVIFQNEPIDDPGRGGDECRRIRRD